MIWVSISMCTSFGEYASDVDSFVAKKNIKEKSTLGENVLIFQRKIWVETHQVDDSK